MSFEKIETFIVENVKKKVETTKDYSMKISRLESKNKVKENWGFLVLKKKIEFT